ncbi:type I restriction endonuclease [Bdellovibrio sp. 22V]|uniref:type I restriction endonuclease n=1 Tax=Bdellovibrio sp. 22V TaxID=3044166 RepID=UPI00254278A8|nr:type I restriction endonuclease [Bdellovibrio sp. 22V]WII71453.1 type I restriction endonuclease [Bdellovibrio sp. 22V]
MEHENILTESDVEQKFLYRILVTPKPLGLGLSATDIRTKADIRKIVIGKGQNQKLYYPDYVIVIDGLPVLIVEAKAPKENLEEALREARLYASEINALFPNKVNPCARIIASNGNQTIACKWDSNEIDVEFGYSDVDATNPEFAKFVEYCEKSILIREVTSLKKERRKETKFLKPIHLLGGRTVQNESVGENSFGVNISLEYKYLFNPENLEERALIAKNAYIASKKKLSQVAHMDKIIRSSVKPVKDNESVIIQDTAKPLEFIDLLKDKKRIKNNVCLLVGSVGSGKTTFTDYLREVALPEDVRKETFWVHLNLNNAPTSRDVIYEWVIDEILSVIKMQNTSFDFDEAEFVKKIFAPQILAFVKGPASLLKDSNPNKYDEMFVEHLVSLQRDKRSFLKAVIKYFYVDKNKILMVVFDNSDKRDRDTQLLLFEVANWLKESFVCTILLPLRDSTFDNFRKTPPLDTVIKDMVFRIEPPLLDKVIYERFRFAMREMEKDSSEFYYSLSNGMRVSCNRTEIKKYLQCILTSLFQNQFFKRLITGIAGRDIRKGLEIFLDFCKSGHISEDDILKIRQSNGDFTLPNHIISRIFFRGTRRYYNDENSMVKNIFHSYATDEIPDPYIRHEILIWLKDKYSTHGPNNIKGFHPVKSLVRDMLSRGHSEKRILDEVGSLTKAACILSESTLDSIDENDLVSIAPSGFVHLELSRSNIDYLSSIAEDSLFRELEKAQNIADNMTGKKHQHMSKFASIDNAENLIKYLQEYREYFLSNPEAFLQSEDQQKIFLLDEIHQFVQMVKMKDSSYNELEKLIESYPPGYQCSARISHIVNYGIFVEFGLHGVGFIHQSQTPNPDSFLASDYEIGDEVAVEVLSFRRDHKRFLLKISDA